MGINDLQFSPSQLAALYPDSLIGEPAYPFKGENRRSICILAYSEKEEFLSEGQLAFLGRVLTACRYSMEDIALINTKRYPVDFNRLREQLDPQMIIFWGKNQNIGGMPVDYPEMTSTIHESIKILRISEVELMSGDDPEGIPLKKELWASLKNIFSL